MYIYISDSNFHPLLLKELEIKHKERDLGEGCFYKCSDPVLGNMTPPFLSSEMPQPFNHQVGKAIKYHSHNRAL